MAPFTSMRSEGRSMHTSHLMGVILKDSYCPLKRDTLFPTSFPAVLEDVESRLGGELHLSGFFVRFGGGRTMMRGCFSWFSLNQTSSEKGLVSVSYPDIFQQCHPLEKSGAKYQIHIKVYTSYNNSWREKRNVTHVDRGHLTFH